MKSIGRYVIKNLWFLILVGRIREIRDKDLNRFYYFFIGDGGGGNLLYLINIFFFIFVDCIFFIFVF